jgi:hypothetical protein
MPSQQPDGQLQKQHHTNNNEQDTNETDTTKQTNKQKTGKKYIAN